MRQTRAVSMAGKAREPVTGRLGGRGSCFGSSVVIMWRVVLSVCDASLVCYITPGAVSARSASTCRYSPCSADRRACEHVALCACKQSEPLTVCRLVQVSASISTSSAQSLEFSCESLTEQAQRLLRQTPVARWKPALEPTDCSPSPPL